MNLYKIDFTDRAKKDIAKIDKSGRKTEADRVRSFIAEIRKRPRNGLGKPKQLKHHNGEIWARKINAKDRFVYEIFEDEKIILVQKSIGHYDDK